MSQLRALSQLVPRGGQSRSDITSAPDTAWSLVGKGSDTLRAELEVLYWEGVQGEIENIVRNVKLWQQPDLASVVLEKETPEEERIHGFTTFLDQVSDEARSFALRQGVRPFFRVCYCVNVILTFLRVA